MSATQIRCHTCGQWNHYDDSHLNCTNCNADLRPVSEAEKANLELRKTSGDLKVPIYETDSKFKRFAKHVYNAVVLVYLTIIAFFLWVFAAGPG